MFTVLFSELAEGNKQEIDTIAPSHFLLEKSEPFLRFTKPLHVHGIIYGTAEEILLNLTIDGTAEIPCRICNEWCEIRITAKLNHFTKKKEEIEENFWDYSSEIRESFLLEIPEYTECEGNCKERTKIQELAGPKERCPFNNLL